MICDKINVWILIQKGTLMLKKITAALSAAMLTICLYSCSMKEPSEKETVHHTDVPPKMMFLGDSIAAGYGLEGYTSTDNYNCPSYSNILKEQYQTELSGKCGHTMINKAVSGYTSDDLIKQIQSGGLDDDLRDCDAVVVSIGGNDLLGILLQIIGELGIDGHGSFDAESIDFAGVVSSLLSMGEDADKALEQFDINIVTISEELNKRTEGTVFVQTLYDPLEELSKGGMIYQQAGSFVDEKIERLNEIIAENAASGYRVIDVAADFKGKAQELTNIGSFDIHPNAEGHKVIAKAVDAAFRKVGFQYTASE